MNNTFYYNLNRDMLREVMVKIGLEKIDTQEQIMVKALLVLLDNSTIGLIMSLEFAWKLGFKL